MMPSCLRPVDGIAATTAAREVLAPEVKRKVVILLVSVTRHIMFFGIRDAIGHGATQHAAIDGLGHDNAISVADERAAAFAIVIFLGAHYYVPSRMTRSSVQVASFSSFALTSSTAASSKKAVEKKGENQRRTRKQTCNDGTKRDANREDKEKALERKETCS